MCDWLCSVGLFNARNFLSIWKIWRNFPFAKYAPRCVFEFHGQLSTPRSQNIQILSKYSEGISLGNGATFCPITKIWRAKTQKILESWKILHLGDDAKVNWASVKKYYLRRWQIVWPLCSAPTRHSAVLSVGCSCSAAPLQLGSL